MNINKIVFKLNEQEKIIIELEESFENIDCCYREHMNFYRDDKILCHFSLDTIRYYLATLQILLKSALANKLQLHESITLDVGFLDNEDCQEKKNLVYDGVHWVGRKYAFIAGYLNEKSWFSSWIYNDISGNIIFELTPKYRWYFYVKKEAKKYKDYIPYEEWIKNYKPLLIRTIPKDVAEQWLHQAQEILKNIEKTQLGYIDYRCIDDQIE
jgi:hypothetical protein